MQKIRRVMGWDVYSSYKMLEYKEKLQQKLGTQRMWRILLLTGQQEDLLSSKTISLNTDQIFLMLFITSVSQSMLMKKWFFFIITHI